MAARAELDRRAHGIALGLVLGVLEPLERLVTRTKRLGVAPRELVQRCLLAEHPRVEERRLEPCQVACRLERGESPVVGAEALADVAQLFEHARDSVASRAGRLAAAPIAGSYNSAASTFAKVACARSPAVTAYSHAFACSPASKKWSESSAADSSPRASSARADAPVDIAAPR